MIIQVDILNIEISTLKGNGNATLLLHNVEEAQDAGMQLGGTVALHSPFRIRAYATIVT